MPIRDEDRLWGPAMGRLTEQQRRFVQAMAADPFGSARKWAIAAGYSNKSDGAKVSAHRLMQDEGIQAAILEFSKSLLWTVGPILATTVMLKTAANPRHKRQLQAAAMLANRVGLHEVQEIHHVRHQDESADGLVKRLEVAAAILELSPVEQQALREKLLGPNTKLIEGKVADG